MKYSRTAAILRAFVALFLALASISALTMPFFAVEISPADISVSAQSALLLDAADKTVIYQKNAEQRMGMASTTKIMTALVAAERLPLDRQISISPEAVGIEGSSVYLCAEELLSARELLLALMLASANDAAVALAIEVAGSIEAFAELMNKRAQQLGLRDTNFTNPHGLDDQQHYTTAHDLALIAAAALENPVVREIASTKKAVIPQGVTPENGDGASTRYLKNHNKMLSLYDGAIGMKTGFTKKTGRCLVSAAERDGLTLIAVTLSAPDDWNDHTRMLDLGFSLYERVTLFEIGEFRTQYAVAGGKDCYVTLTNTQPISITLPKTKEEAVCTVLASRRFEFAPIEKATILASLSVRVGKKYATSPLAAAYSVERREKRK